MMPGCLPSEMVQPNAVQSSPAQCSVQRVLASAFHRVDLPRQALRSRSNPWALSKQMSGLKVPLCTLSVCVLFYASMSMLVSMSMPLLLLTLSLCNWLEAGWPA